MSNKPKLYVMIGVPGSGKSTWIQNQQWTENCVVVSTDSYLERFSKKTGKTYNQSFDLFMERAIKLMVKQVLRAKINKKDIIWDQTSTTISSRIKKFNMLPEYYKIAVVMKKLDREVLDQRLNNRVNKIIPKNVIDSMCDFFEEPSLAEGFNEIWKAE